MMYTYYAVIICCMPIMSTCLDVDDMHEMYPVRYVCEVTLGCRLLQYGWILRAWSGWTTGGDRCGPLRVECGFVLPSMR